MSYISRILGKMFKLPPAETYDIIVDRNLKITMPDGVTLLADHYYPRRNSKAPTILIRTPYGKNGLPRILYGELFAERGFQVLIQCCRGTFESGGKLNPFFDEKADGLATIEWIKSQSWFSGELCTNGPSYLGYTQWAIAASAGNVLKAMGLQVTTSEFRSQTYPGDTFGLHDPLSWTFVINIQRDAPILVSLIMRMLGQEKKLKPAFEHLPLGDADSILLKKKVDFWQDWLNNSEPPYEWWNAADFSTSVSQVQVPINMVGGWYDIFLPWQLKDYGILRKAGQTPFLLIGPWFHTSLALYSICTKEALAWFRAHLLGDRSLLRQSPVRLFVMGKGEWRDFPEWPPQGYLPQKWYLHQDRHLCTKVPAQSEPDRYLYNPANPTPSVGGVMMSPEAGSKDNRKLEMRPDVLVYSSDVLETDLEVIGPIQAHLYIKSSLEYTDFFCRLCDVYPSGKSLNISDGIVRLRPGRPAPQTYGCKEIDIELWPTAYCFRKGHKIRLQVSSGAHPRFARNLGTGQSPATAITMHIAEQEIYHDSDHPSSIILQVKG